MEQEFGCTQHTVAQLPVPYETGCQCPFHSCAFGRMVPILFPPNPSKQQMEFKKEGPMEDNFFPRTPTFLRSCVA